MSVRRSILTAAAALGFAAQAVLAAGPGDLDPTFAQVGRLKFGFGLTDNEHSAVAMQDGKVVVGGWAVQGNGSVFQLVRYNDDGSLDPSFGGDGVVLTSFNTQFAEIHSIAIQADGKLVAAGTATPLIAVARYLPDGSLDTTWSGDGKATIADTEELLGQAMVLQGNKVVVAGRRKHSSSEDQFVVARFNADGSPDTTFDGDGLVTTAIGTSESEAFGVRIQPDGRILAVGVAYDPGPRRIAMVRYLDNGALDTSFGGDGVVVDTRASYGYDVAYSNNTTFPHSSRILVAGTSDTDDAFAVFCYRTDGTPDTLFGNQGKVLGFPARSDASSIHLLTSPFGDPTGFLVSGTADDSLVVAKFLLGGSLDTSFNGDGRAVAPILPYGAYGFAMAFTGSKIVVAGLSYSGLDRDGVTVRYNSNGSLDTTFDGDGIRIDHIGGRSSTAQAVCTQADGKIVVAGSVFSTAGNSDFGVMRCNADGTFDPSFGAGGFVMTTIGAQADIAHGVAMQSDGKIVVVGETGNSPDQSLALVRYNSNGSLDPSFDGDGIVITPGGVPFSRVGHAVAVQPDGKIVVAGMSELFNGVYLTVLRYLANGTLDYTKVTRFGQNVAFGYAIALQPDGKVIAAGTSYDLTTQSFACVRLLPDGAFDTSFDGDGQVRTAINGFDEARSVLVQPDGRVVLAGSSGDGISQNVALVRYLSDGSLDASFDGDGRVTHAPGPAGYLPAIAALEPSGRIVVASTAPAGNHANFRLMRVQADGALDLSYGSGGIASYDLDFGSWDNAWAVALDSAGRALVAGDGGGLGAVIRVLGGDTPSNVVGGPEVAGGFRLDEPWPNPTHRSTAISFHLAAPGPLSLAIFDVRGRLIRRLVAETRIESGNHTISWDGRNQAGLAVSSGVYLLRVQRGSEARFRQITVLR